MQLSLYVGMYVVIKGHGWAFVTENYLNVMIVRLAFFLLLCKL